MPNVELGPVKHVALEFDIVADCQRTEIKSILPAMKSYAQAAGDSALLGVSGHLNDDKALDEHYRSRRGDVRQVFSEMLIASMYPEDESFIEGEMADTYYEKYFREVYEQFAIGPQKGGHNLRDDARPIIGYFDNGPIHIVGTKRQAEIDKFLASYGYYAGVIQANGGLVVSDESLAEAGKKPFPEPDAFQHIADAVHIDNPSELLVIGSSVECIQAAKRFGAFTVGITLEQSSGKYDYLPAEEAPDAVHNSLKMFETYLSNGVAA